MSGVQVIQPASTIIDCMDSAACMFMPVSMYMVDRGIGPVVAAASNRTDTTISWIVMVMTFVVVPDGGDSWLLLKSEFADCAGERGSDPQTKSKDSVSYAGFYGQAE